MNKLENPNCSKCGGKMSIRFVSSSGMDITPTGMFADCSRCGFSKKIQSLDDKSELLNFHPEIT